MAKATVAHMGDFPDPNLAKMRQYLAFASQFAPSAHAAPLGAGGLIRQ